MGADMIASVQPESAPLSLTRTAYRALGFRFDFCSSSPLAERLVQRLYGEYECQEDDEAAHTVELYRAWDDGDYVWCVGVDGEVVARQPRLAAALGLLEFEVSRRIVEAGGGFVPLHGALVRGAERTLLISGVSGAGKTTLALALSARGYQVLGDDIAMLNPRDGLVRALPRCLHVDEHTWRLLREEHAHVPAPAATAGLLTPADLGASIGQPVRVGSVLMMRGAVPSAPQIAHLSQAEMVVLMESQVRWQGRPPARTLDALSRMLGRATCYSLVRGGLGETADLVAQIAGPPLSLPARSPQPADAAAG
jgi:hypothetical protein